MLIRIISLFLFFTFTLGAQKEFDASRDAGSIDMQISMLPTADESYALIDAQLQQPIFVKKVVLECDIAFDAQEFYYLTQLHDNMWISPEILKDACWHLKRKNKFDHVRFTLTPDVLHKPGKQVSSAPTYTLTVSLQARWTFNKVECKGPLIAKEKYEQSYAIAYADIFDLTKHQHGLTKVQQALKNDGYLKAHLSDYIAYDKALKAVSVSIYIEDAQRFTINDVICKVTLPGQGENSADLEEKIKQKFLISLQNTYSVKQDIDACLEQIRGYLTFKGYLQPKILLSTTIDKDKETVELSITIQLNQKQRFVFLGNHFFTTQELLQELLVVEGSAFIIPPTLLVDDLIQLYKRKGFWSVCVTYKEEHDTYYFIINEGSRNKLANILIKETGSETSLVDMHKINELFPQSMRESFDSEVIKQSVQHIIEEYIKQGYWYAHIISEEFIAGSEANTYNLEVIIDPGIRRMLKKVAIKDHTYLLKEDIFKPLTVLEKEIPFDLTLIAEQQKWLIAYFRKKGLLYNKITPSLEQTPEGDILTWHCQATTKSLFGKTVIQGDHKIKSNIMLRELMYKEGDEFDKDRVQQSITRLKKLGIFKSISLVPDNQSISQYKEDTKDTTSKTMILKCVEDSPFEIRGRAGLQQISKNFTYTPLTTFKVGGSLLWKNPTGRADIAGFDFDITRYSRNTSIQYTLPWISNIAVSTQFRLFSDAFSQPLLGRSGNLLYKANYDGFLIKSSYQSAYVQTDMITALQFIKLSGLSTDLAKLIKFEPALIDVRKPYFVIEPSIIIDRLDNKVDPKCGSFTAISCKGMFPLHLKSGSFLKLLGEQSFFYPLYNDSIIGAIRFRLGHIFCSDFTKLLPTERFYLGGSNSLRGYEPAMVPPLNACKSNNEKFWVPVGGKSMANINAELRFPLYNQLSGVIFNDMGVLSQQGFTTLTNGFLGATGFGLRYATPIGPIRFDIGWKWHKRDESDRRYAWFFTFGHAF